MLAASLAHRRQRTPVVRHILSLQRGSRRATNPQQPLAPRCRVLRVGEKGRRAGPLRRAVLAT